MVKSVAKRLGAMRVYRPLRTAWTVRQSPERVWSRALPAEVEFWRGCLADRVRTLPEYRRRADPGGEVADPTLRECIERVPSETVAIVDVGSGPLSAVGQRWAGKRVELTATDPLADEYRALMEEAGIEPPAPPVACAGEDLVATFGHDRFDVAHAINSVDHARDPVRVVEAMVDVVRPGGFVVLVHWRQEAVRNSYRHLHQWNFDVRDGELLLWRTRGAGTNLTRLLAPRARVECVESGGIVTACMEKRA